MIAFYTFTPSAKLHLRLDGDYVLLGREKDGYQYWHAGSFKTLQDAITRCDVRGRTHIDVEHVIAYNGRIFYGPGRELP